MEHVDLVAAAELLLDNGHLRPAHVQNAAAPLSERRRKLRRWHAVPRPVSLPMQRVRVRREPRRELVRGNAYLEISN